MSAAARLMEAVPERQAGTATVEIRGASRQFTTSRHDTLALDSVDLEDVLGEIDTYGGDLLHGGRSSDDVL